MDKKMVSLTDIESNRCIKMYQLALKLEDQNAI